MDDSQSRSQIMEEFEEPVEGHKINDQKSYDAGNDNKNLRKAITFNLTIEDF